MPFQIAKFTKKVSQPVHVDFVFDGGHNVLPQGFIDFHLLNGTRLVPYPEGTPSLGIDGRIRLCLQLPYNGLLEITGRHVFQTGHGIGMRHSSSAPTVREGECRVARTTVFDRRS